MTTDINQIVEIVTPFDKFEHEPLLDEIQGNILKSHGRNHAVYLFLKFKGKEGDQKAAMQAKQWIGSFTHRYVTSALEQAEQAKLHRQKKDVPGKLFANFFLTRAGYMHLGYSYQQLPNEDAFRQGMEDANMQNELGDDSTQWESGFKKGIHALVLLAADKIVGPRTQEVKDREQREKERLLKQPALLKRKVEALKKELEAIAEVVHQEIGYVLRDENTGEEIEHFGFRDGVSQPLFLKRDIDKEREHSDFSKWDPRAPLSLVLFKDPLGRKEESYGSFLVFRKLEQNVGGWNRDVVKLANDLGILPENVNLLKPDDTQNNENPLTLKGWMDREQLTEEQRQKVTLAEAYTMGRFRDGKPTLLSDQPRPIPTDPQDNNFKDNNFNYAEDSQGSKCPFFAHARKVNPRGDTGSESLVSTPTLLKEEKMHRIVRRGINYGPLPSKVPEKDAGLLFMCFQASLAKQFNFMQKAWAKERNFIKREVGTDVVIGVEKKEQLQGNQHLTSVPERYNWPTKWGTQEKTEVTFKHWVTMKGGEFFFAPCMSFLKSLAPEPSRNIEFRGVPEQEIKAAQDIIALLRNYKERNWAIGLNGDTMEPDKFLTFFNQRKLPFEFYLQNKVPLGDYSAYDKNIATLNTYIKDIINQESDACEYKSAELEEYKDLHWAIGLNGDTLQPDGFVNFFGERELPFKFYVRSTTGVSLGEYSAYDQNIKTLNDYITTLNNYIITLKPVKLVAKHSGKVLAVAGADKEDGANVLQVTKKDDDPSQLWLLEAAGNDYYYLVAKHSGKALDVAGASTEDAGNVLQWQKHGGDNQQWKLESAGDGYYYLVAKRSGKVLDVADGSRGEGANVIQYTKSGSDNQKWKIEDA